MKMTAYYRAKGTPPPRQRVVILLYQRRSGPGEIGVQLAIRASRAVLL